MIQAKNEPPQLQRRRLLLRYWAAALDATGELVLHAGSLETVVASNAQTLDQAQLKELLGEAKVMLRRQCSQFEHARWLQNDFSAGRIKQHQVDYRQHSYLC
jgi:hypothetical protein